VQAVHTSAQKNIVAKKKPVKHPQHANSSTQQISKQNPPLVTPISSTDTHTHTYTHTRTHIHPNPNPHQTPGKMSPGQAYSTPTSLPDQNPRSNTLAETGSLLEAPTTKGIQIELPSSLPNSEAKSQGQASSSNSPSSQSVQPRPTNLKSTVADPSRGQPSTWKAPKTEALPLLATSQANTSPGMEAYHGKAGDSRPIKKRKVTASQSE
jgi:hypothetical protein